MTLQEAMSKKCACIYKLNFPDGKSYIGKSKCLSDRIKLYQKRLQTSDSSKVVEAIKEFGFDNIDFEILSEPKNLSNEELNLSLSILEIYHIRKNDTIYPNGYNVSIGGEILGIPSDCISTDGKTSVYSGGFKPVLVYDLDGNFVEEFESIEKCAYNFGVESSVVASSIDKRREIFHGKYMLRLKRYGIVPKKILPVKINVVNKTVVNKVYKDVIVERKVVSPRNTILKYDIDGNFCEEYDTVTDAAISIGRKYIQKGVIYGNFIFFDYDGGEIKKNIGKITKKSVRMPKYSEALSVINDESLDISSKGWSTLINDFSVGQYTLKGELIETYDNLKMASYETGIPYSGIWACVFGRTKRSHGFIWKKIEE